MQAFIILDVWTVSDQREPTGERPQPIERRAHSIQPNNSRPAPIRDKLSDLGAVFISSEIRTISEQEAFEALPKMLKLDISKPSAPPELVNKVMNGDITTHKEYIALKKELEAAEDEFFQSIRQRKSKVVRSCDKCSSEDFMKREACRCVECSYLCNKCVEVCPNRANMALDLRDTGLFDDPFQILHIDAYCNECANCATFCPHDGGPYLKKFTLFSRPDDFENSTNSGFLAENDQITIRLDGKVVKGEIDRDGRLQADVPEEVKAMIETVFISYSYLLGPVEE